MESATLNAILDRIRTGTTTAADAQHLTELFRRDPALARPHNLRPSYTQPPATELPHFHDNWALRIHAPTTVAITFDPTRYAWGELVLLTTYQLPNGSTETDSTRRVAITPQHSRFIRDLWDSLFDEVCAARFSEPTKLIIHIDLPENLADVPIGIRDYVRAVAEIAAVELRAFVSGAAPNPYDFT